MEYGVRQSIAVVTFLIRLCLDAVCLSQKLIQQVIHVLTINSPSLIYLPLQCIIA